MLKLLIVLLVIWLALGIIGIAVKGLVWLAVIGAVLFVVTAVWGFVKRETSTGADAKPDRSGASLRICRAGAPVRHFTGVCPKGSRARRSSGGQLDHVSEDRRQDR